MIVLGDASPETVGSFHFFDDQSERDFNRTHRVTLLGEAFTALMDGRLPSREAALFVGGGGMAWLENGGDLARDFFKVVRPKSHVTPSKLWRQINAHRDDAHDKTLSVGCIPLPLPRVEK